MKRFIILPLVLVLGVFVSVDALRAVGPLALQEDAGEETSRAEAIRAHFDKLVSEDKDVKREALLYFGKVDKTFEAEVPLFTAALKDKRYQVRAISAYALGKIGGAAVGSIPDVEELLSDSSASVQKYAKRALERLRTLKPDPKRLTAGEATKLMALAIGEWEIKGEYKNGAAAPVKVEGVDTIRWKKKGTSFEVLRVDTRTGRPRDKSLEQEYDPVSGQFILRRIVRGEVVETSRRDYDPANRTWTDTVISPKLPPGIRQESLSVDVNDDKFTMSFKVYDEGRLVESFQGEGNRKPASKKLTAKEAADALALLIGEWEGKGQRKDKGSDWVPVSIELKDVIRWKEKGKSIEGTFHLVVDGKQGPARAYEKTYDPAIGLFIFRGGVAGSELKLEEHRRYDPATRTFQTISFFPESEGLERKFKFSITESGRISYIFEIYEDGKLWGEQKLDAMRKPAASAAPEKLSEEADADFYMKRGRAYRKKGEHIKAITDFSNAIRLEPDNALAHYQRGWTYTVIGALEKSILDFSQAIRLKPDYIAAYGDRGVAYGVSGNDEKAIEDFSHIIRLEPNLFQGYYSRGEAYHRKKRFDEAIADLTKVIRLKPDLRSAYSSRARTYMAKGKHDKAIMDYNEAIKLEPDYAAAWRNRGWAYSEKGDYNKAIMDYTVAIKLKPDDSLAWGSRGLAYQRLGNEAKAQADFLKAEELEAKEKNRR